MCNGTGTMGVTDNSGYLKDETIYDDDISQEVVDEPKDVPAEEEPEFIYSLDGERFDLYDNIMDEVYNTYEVGEKITISKGRPEKVYHWDFVKNIDLVGILVDMATDEDGDFSDDYHNDMTPDIQDKVLSDLCKSLNKYVKHPNYCRVIDITEEIVTVKDSLQGE
jgi:hypothetical protein